MVKMFLASLDLKCYYSVQNVHVLANLIQLNSVHILTPCSCTIQLNIFLLYLDPTLDLSP
jgi:hypothetical protein